LRVAEVTRVKTELEWRASGTEIELELVLGSNFILSGVLSPPRALASLCPAQGASIACYCSHTFKGRVSVASQQSLAGFSSLINHQFHAHGAREGSTLNLVIAGDELRALP